MEALIIIVSLVVTLFGTYYLSVFIDKKLSKKSKNKDDIESEDVEASTSKEVLPFNFKDEYNVNHNLFLDVENNSILKFEKEVKLHLLDENLVVSFVSGKSAKFLKFYSKGEDTEKIFISLDNLNIGVVDDNEIYTLIKIWLKNDFYFCGHINKVNTETLEVTYKIAFYVPVEYFENRVFKIVKVTKSVDEFEYSSRFDNLSCVSVGDEIEIRRLKWSDTYVLDCSGEIGELPSSAKNFIGDLNAIGFIESFDEDEIKASVRVFLIDRPDFTKWRSVVMPYMITFNDKGEIVLEYEKSKTVNRPGKGCSILGFPSDYICIDLETTGFEPQFDEIIEMSAIKVNCSGEVSIFSQLVKPTEELDEYIQNLTGISNEMLANAPTIEEVMPKFIDFVGEAILIGHNTSFDIRFIYDNYFKLTKKPFKNDYVDTLRLSRILCPDLKHHRLKDLVKLFDLQVNGEHRALFDCEATIMIFEKLRELAIKQYGSVENFENSITTRKSRKKVDLSTLSPNSEDIDVTNPFYDKYVVFTGTLEKYQREQASQIIVNLGGHAQNDITKKTDFLIIGSYENVSEEYKSSKQKKAESYILKGQDLKIISEGNFYDMLSFE